MAPKTVNTVLFIVSGGTVRGTLETDPLNKCQVVKDILEVGEPELGLVVSLPSLPAFCVTRVSAPGMSKSRAKRFIPQALMLSRLDAHRAGERTHAVAKLACWRVSINALTLSVEAVSTTPLEIVIDLNVLSSLQGRIRTEQTHLCQYTWNTLLEIKRRLSSLSHCGLILA